MKIRKYLTESKMNGSDISTIENLIDKPKNTTIVLKSFSNEYDESEREVDIKKIQNGVELSYNLDFDELTDNLVDICDTNDYKFKTHIERPINIMNFTITK